MSARAEAQVRPPASPFVSPDHWSLRVLRRLDVAGLLPAGVDVARQSIPQEEIAALLDTVEHARARAYHAHLRKEFKTPDTTGLSLVERASVLEYHAAHDQLAPGVGYDTLSWTGARALEDDSDLGAGVRFGATFAPHVAARIATLDNHLEEWQLVAAAGLFGAWVGRRELGYGTGAGGGLVVNAHRFDGAGLFLTRPLRLPLLGPVRFETHVAKIDNVLNLQGEQNAIEPWFWTARGSFEPFPFLRIGINRGMMFGGAGNLPVTFERVAENILGFYSEDEEDNSFANQVISVDLRLRVPGVPVAAYLDWGSDDAAGGWWDVPGVLGGLEYVHIDSTFDVAVGVEHLQFSRACCGNSIWYRNAWFRGGWADGAELLGHRLGGHGREWRLFANGGFGSGRVIASGAVFSRRRRMENLFTPDWEGQSTGVRAGADLAAVHYLRLILDAEAEWGAQDWSATRLTATLRYGF